MLWPSQLRKILQQTQAVGLAFLGMELSGKKLSRQTIAVNGSG